MIYFLHVLVLSARRVGEQDSVLRPRGSKTVLARMPLDRRAYQRLLGCMHTRTRITGGRGGGGATGSVGAGVAFALYWSPLCLRRCHASRPLTLCVPVPVCTHTHTQPHNTTHTDPQAVCSSTAPECHRHKHAHKTGPSRIHNHPTRVLDPRKGSQH